VRVVLRGIFEFVAFVGAFLMIRKIHICDVPLRCHFFFYDDNNPSQHAITRIFQPCFSVSILFFAHFIIFSIALFHIILYSGIQIGASENERASEMLGVAQKVYYSIYFVLYEKI